MKFRYRVTATDLFKFQEYHIFHTTGCVMVILIPLLAIACAVMSIRGGYTTRGIIYLVIGLAFAGYAHISAWLNSQKQAKLSESLSRGLIMELSETGLKTENGDQTSEIAWNQLVKLRQTKSLILGYTDSIHCFLIPKNHLELLDEEGNVTSGDEGTWQLIYEYIRVHMPAKK